MSIIIVEVSKNIQCYLLLQMEFEFVFGSLSCCCNVCVVAIRYCIFTNFLKKLYCVACDYHVTIAFLNVF